MAQQSEHPVLPLFIFDRHILDELDDPRDARVSFLHQEVRRLGQELKEQGSSILVNYGFPEQVWKALLDHPDYEIKAVYTNHDYEPYAMQRDREVAKLLEAHNIPFHTFKDQVIFEKKEVVKDDGDPYVVFTPYSKKWLARLEEGPTSSKHGFGPLESRPSEEHLDRMVPSPTLPIPSLEEMGFELTDIEFPPREVPKKRIKQYGEKRNFPAEKGTSRLGVHFRFGTISIRDKARKAQKLSNTYLNELIWRDFYAMILANFPRVEKESFRQKYDRIPWRNNKEEFAAWCEGRTGYPIVDAGMRELNQTGYMHNRVRMITASFLTKHLLVDWRWGEAYFGRKLLDYELASNNGGWQWAAGTGTDAAPYFRIFNPYSQQKKFDKDLKYTRNWVPELDTSEYPDPIVDHKAARERCLSTYKAALSDS